MISICHDIFILLNDDHLIKIAVVDFNYLLCQLQLVHYVNRDSFGLANDFLSLGFIPEGADLSLVADALQAAFSDGTRHSKDFQVYTMLEFPNCYFIL